MKLTFSGAPEMAAPRSVVWSCLMDPDFVAQSAPGVERVDRIDDTHYTVVSALGVGSIKLRYNLNIELTDIEAPERATVKALGNAPGSVVEMVASITLEEPAPGRTIMRWNSESVVSGPLAGIGGGLLEGTARKLTGQFWEDFARRIPVAS